MSDWGENYSGLDRHKRREEDSYKTQGMLVLVIEDDAVIRKSIVKAIQKTSWRVIEATTAEEGIREILRRHDDLDAVITDRDTGGVMNGDDVAGLVAKLLPSTRICMHTGSIVQPVHSRIRVIPKPSPISALVDWLSLG